MSVHSMTVTRGGATAVVFLYRLAVNADLRNSVTADRLAFAAGERTDRHAVQRGEQVGLDDHGGSRLAGEISSPFGDGHHVTAPHRAHRRR
jgi:hypothetical protein